MSVTRSPKKILFFTLFPKTVDAPLRESFFKRAAEDRIVEFQVIDIRASALDRNRSVDDSPYGGGAGMLLRADVLARSLDTTLGDQPRDRVWVTYLSPQGSVWNSEQAKLQAKRLTAQPPLLAASAEAGSEIDTWALICGHYEGVDERFIEARVDAEVSVGDYVLTGGELPALLLVDSVLRWIPGVLGNSASAAEDSLEDGLLKYPQYTRPALWEGRPIPEVLISGHHAKIAEWRQSERERRTQEKRPDLWVKWRNS